MFRARRVSSATKKVQPLKMNTVEILVKEGCRVFLMMELLRRVRLGAECGTLSGVVIGVK